MRLTLRTMLAYLDDILEPADRDDIGHKIEESQFALQLVQRVRDCTRKARLSAPPVAGKGMDPNTVAEYLDNTLAGEAVPDFEKVCLESDVYLAEVAACHQILTMVLGQPAQINPKMKSRMYEIITQSSPPSAEELKLAPAHDERAAIPDELWVKPARAKPEIPDYLRQPSARWNWKTIVAGIVVLLVLAGAITMALGPWETNPIAGLLGLRSSKDTKVADNSKNAQAAPNNAVTNDATASNPNGTAPSLMQPNAATGADATAGGSSRTGDVADNPSVPVAPVPEMTNAAPSAASQNLPSSTNAPNSSVAAAGNANSNVGIENRGGERPKPDDTSRPPELPQPVAAGSRMSDGGRMPTRPDLALPGDVTLNPAKSNADEQTPPLPQDADAPLGLFLPTKTVVLLKFDPAAGQWNRLAPGAALFSGDQLLVLPTFRPTLTLSAGLTLQLSPETLLQLQAPDAHGVPGIKIMYGRLVALTTGKPGTRIRLSVGSTSGIVTFSDADARLGVEVRRFLPAGTNPEAQDSPVVADLYAANGRFEWSAGGGNPVTFTAPQHWTVMGNPAAAAPVAPAAITIPKWINTPESLNSLDERVSEMLAGNLEGGKDLLHTMQEFVGDRRVEFRVIGVKSLALLDDFAPLVTAFRDEGQKGSWIMEIACVRAGLTRGPATAAKFREASERQFGDDVGKDFYRMFWGYTKEQLQIDQAAKLVGYLESDELAFRAVAFEDLKEITGKSFSYNATEIPAVRRQPVRRWQEELKGGRIVPREPGAKP